ncbi:MAG: response regulator [Acidobacteria bacterium]|jgi:CheY-like chemotaxis protein|nr:response regulator [Acidobacteriota bacterium]
MRILVVDDDPDVVEYLSSFLEDEGCEVASAGDERTALEEVERSTPDAILIDVMLPGRSGLDLLLRLRRDPRWTEIPLVLVTGDDSVLKDECRSYLEAHPDVRGPDRVLGKPMERDLLLSVLKGVAVVSTTPG